MCNIRKLETEPGGSREVQAVEIDAHTIIEADPTAGRPLHTTDRHDAVAGTAVSQASRLQHLRQDQDLAPASADRP